MRKIVIVGGGTAGWLTAMYAKKYMPDVESVTVIESSKIGILGAGEGTTPNFPGLIKRLGINEDDFMEKTGTTKKYGIDFINWRGDGYWFPHRFQSDYRYYAYHFDARLVAKYFKEFAMDEMGILHVDSLVTDMEETEIGISKLILEDGNSLDCDFVFDCSGFARLIIGKHYKTKWKSYKDQLICDKAFAFFLPQKNKISEFTRTMTQSISMPNGWMWQAPLVHRWGCGYVYNDKYISFEDAVKEVEEYVGQKIEVVKQFQFDAGSYEKQWIKNCVAVGLSSSFLEPLEATSLMTVIVGLKKLMDYKFDEKHRDRYNRIMENVNEQNMIFIRHHYHCDRNDTEFWRDYRKIELPEKLQKFYNPDGKLKTITQQMVYEVMGDKIISGMFNQDSFSVVWKAKIKQNELI